MPTIIKCTIQWLQKQLSIFLGCTRREVNGIIVLLCLLIGLVLLPLAFRLYLTRANQLVTNKGDIALLEETLIRIEQQSKKRVFKQVVFDINSANIRQLQQLQGIGSKLAHRIIKYKKILGGFVHQDKYKEVYGLPDKALKSLMKNSSIAPEAINLSV